MRSANLVLAIILSLPAVAAAAPLPSGETHEPPTWAEPTGTWINIDGSGGGTYRVDSTFWVIGVTSKGDRLRVEWVQNGKTVAKGDCTNYYYEKEKGMTGSCSIDGLKGKGASELVLIYADDQTDKEYVVQSYKVLVKQWKGIGTDTTWGYQPDDLLALAYVRHVDESAYEKTPIFDLWSTNEELSANAVTFRCTVEGTKIPDIDASPGNQLLAAQAKIKFDRNDGKMKATYLYQHYGVAMRIKWGPVENKTNRHLIDNPGKWECALRTNGKAFRTFNFTVGADGMIEGSELAKGKKPWRMVPANVMVDMRIPKDNGGVERRIRPDALKKSVGWGIPWPDSPKAKEAQAAFPPAMGPPD